VGDAEPFLFSGRRPLGCSLADVAHVPASTAAAALLEAEGRNFVVLEGHALLAPGATALDMLEARFFLEGGRAATRASVSPRRSMQAARWPYFRRALEAAGWDTATPLLDDAGARVRWRKM